MKLIVQEAPALKAAVESIVSLVEEGVFEVKKDGLYLRAMDPSQISMVSFFMPKEAFLEYQLEEDKRVGVDITQLSSILARGKRGEKAELSVDEGRLVIQFSAEKRKRTFRVPLLEVGEGAQKEPKIEFASNVKITADAFKETLKDAKLVSSHVRLMLDPKSFTVDVKGDSGDVHAVFDNGSNEVSEIKTSNGARSTFPLQYLEDIVKASGSSSPITINIETDKPLKLEYEVEGAKVVYYLAPRIESD